MLNKLNQDELPFNTHKIQTYINRDLFVSDQDFFSYDMDLVPYP